MQIKLLALVLLIGSASLFAQDPAFTAPLSASSTNCTALSSCLAFDPRGTAPYAYTAVGIAITGTWAATIQFEGTIDCTTWFAVSSADASTGANSTSTTANGSWVANVNGYCSFRARVSAYTSGTATVTIRPAVQSYAPINNPSFTGTATIGATVLGGSGLTTVTYSATPTFTVVSPTVNQGYKITLTGNVTSSTLTTTAAITGQHITFDICQDGTGSRTFVWPTNVTGGGTINWRASVCSRQVFRYDGTNAVALTPMKNYGGASPAAWTITKSAADDAAIEMYEDASSGDFLRLYMPGDRATNHPGFYIDNGVGLYSRAWITISGHTTGANINPPSGDPQMIGCWADVSGPCLQTRPNTNSDDNYSALDSSGNHVFTVDGLGLLKWGAGARAAMDVGLYRSAGGALRITDASSNNANGALYGAFLGLGNSGSNGLWGTNGGDFWLRGDGAIAWGSTADDAKSAKDIGLVRSAAGVLKVTNGSTGQGTLIMKPPTSCSGLATGVLWNNAGTLAICP